MKKVGIVTIFDPFANYGNKLQNYAVRYVLLELGFAADTLYVEKQVRFTPLLYGKAAFHRLTHYRLAGDRRFYKTLKKVRKFQKFGRRYLSPHRIRRFSGLDSQYDFFVLGSDQVWNTAWFDARKKHAFLLTFARPEQKAAFAPSFGADRLDDAWRGWFQKYLPTFSHLSVRETSGAALIRDLTGQTAEVLVDPTLLLPAPAWRTLAEKPRGVSLEKGYILVYMLGQLSRQERAFLEQAAGERSLQIYDLTGGDDRVLLNLSPGEFLYMLDHAALVATDSFHACVFSFLFDRPFVVFRRRGAPGDMGTRLDSFLALFSLRRKRFESLLPSELFASGYSGVQPVLQRERQKALRFLRASLGVSEEA